MVKNLDRDVGKQAYDNLIADVNPPVKVSSGVIAAPAADAAYTRGTALSKDPATGKLYILGTTAPAGLVADCVLCEDTEVTAAGGDAAAPVYTAGCFNDEALTVKEGYTLTLADRDKLRERGIWLQTIFA